MIFEECNSTTDFVEIHLFYVFVKNFSNFDTFNFNSVFLMTTLSPRIKILNRLTIILNGHYNKEDSSIPQENFYTYEYR